MLLLPYCVCMTMQLLIHFPVSLCCAETLSEEGGDLLLLHVLYDDQTGAAHSIFCRQSMLLPCSLLVQCMLDSAPVCSLRYCLQPGSAFASGLRPALLR